MPDYAAMKTELALPENAALTDEQIAANWEVPFDVVVDVPVASIEAFLRSRLLTGGMKRFVTTPDEAATVEQVDGVSELLDLINSSNASSVRMTEPTVAATLEAVYDTMVQFAMMTGTQEAELLALGVNTTTKAAQLGLTADVHDTVSEIAAARFWPGVSP